MSSSIGTRLTLSIFGQSHSDAIGCVLDGFPAGFTPNLEALTQFMQRRAPGFASFATPRKEADTVHFVSGFSAQGTSCGAPICGIIQNTNTRSGDYATLSHILRPGHSDYAAWRRYHGFQDISGGGHFSGRLTAGICIAGGLAKQYLQAHGVRVMAHVASIGTIHDDTFAFADRSKHGRSVLKAQLQTLEERTCAHPHELCTINADAAQAMSAYIDDVRRDADSVGGTIECVCTGVPAGIGSGMFGGLENKLACALFGIPAVKAVEFGEGFGACLMRGSEHNDQMTYAADTSDTSDTSDATNAAAANAHDTSTCENDTNPQADAERWRRRSDAHARDVIFETNHAGGVLGGISTGEPVFVRVGIKPTPSIGHEQQSVDIATKQPALLRISGRHDPCIVPRACVVVEAMCSFTIMDMLLDEQQ